MTIGEYEAVQRLRPDLMLPDYWRLCETMRKVAEMHGIDQLIAARTARLLCMSPGDGDILCDGVYPPAVHRSQYAGHPISRRSKSSVF